MDCQLNNLTLSTGVSSSFVPQENVLLKNDIFLKISKLLKDLFQIDEFTTADIFEKQRSLANGEIFVYPISDTLKYEILVTADRIRILSAKIGEGIKSHVFAAEEIMTGDVTEQGKRVPAGTPSGGARPVPHL